MNYPYMPKSTALWLIENTALTFEQIADFCGLHELEVKNIADAETQKIQGLNPILNGQVTREDIALCESDPTARLTLQESIVRAQNAQNKKGIGYTPKILRQNRLGGILWILKNCPEFQLGENISNDANNIQDFHFPIDFDLNMNDPNIQDDIIF